MTHKRTKNIFARIRKLIELRGEPELVAAWEKIEPFLVERQRELSGSLTEISRWTSLSENLTFILDMIKGLPGNIPREEIFERIIKILHEKLGFGVVLISVYDEKSGLYHRVAQFGIPKDEYAKLKRQPVSREYYEKIMQDKFRFGNLYLVRWWHKEVEVPEDISYVPKVDEGSEWNPNDMLIVPIYSQDNRLLGVISLDKPPEGKVPSRDLLIHLEIVAAQAGRALEESFVYEKITLQLTRMELLYEVSTRAATVENIKEFADYVCRTLVEKFDYLWTGVLLTESETETLYVLSQCGLSDTQFQGIRYKIGEDGGFVGKVAASGQYVIVNNVAQERRKKKIFTFHPRARSVVAVPIRRHDKVAGVFVIESGRECAFDQEDRRFARTLSNQIASALENIEIRRSIEEELRIRKTLLDVSTTINSILDPTRLYRKIMDILRNTFKYTSAALFLIDESKKYLILKAFAGLMDHKVDEFRLRVGQEGIVGVVAATRKPLIVRDVSQFPLFVPGFKGAKSALAVPIEYRGKVLGVLDVESEKLNAFDETDEQILQLFASQLAVAITNAILYEKLESLATTDGLTGLFNYRVFMSTLEKEVKRSRRLKHPLALIFADLDNFKNYNDTYGHPQGDKVLQLFAQVIVANIREDVDIPARYGGEEFAIILPETSVEESYAVAERIRTQFEKQSGEKLLQKVTASFGVAAYPEDGKNAKELLKAADTALYRAKSLGKNRTCLARDKKNVLRKKEN